MKRRIVSLALALTMCITASISCYAFYDDNHDGLCDNCGCIAPYDSSDYSCNCKKGAMGNTGDEEDWFNDPYINIVGGYKNGDLVRDLDHSGGFIPELENDIYRKVEDDLPTFDLSKTGIVFRK